MKKFSARGPRSCDDVIPANLGQLLSLSTTLCIYERVTDPKTPQMRAQTDSDRFDSVRVATLDSVRASWPTRVFSDAAGRPTCTIQPVTLMRLAR